MGDVSGLGHSFYIERGARPEEGGCQFHQIADPITGGQLLGVASEDRQNACKGKKQSRYLSGGETIILQDEVCSQGYPKRMGVKKDYRPGSGGEGQAPINEKKFSAKKQANDDPVDYVLSI